MNAETAAAYLDLSTTVPEMVGTIVRKVYAHAHFPDKEAEIAAQLQEKAGAATSATAAVDWTEIARRFIEQERWRADGRRLKFKSARP